MAEESTSAAEAAAAQPPLLRVVRGNPSPEELAALVAVVAARSAGNGSAGEPPTRSAWTDRSRLVRQPLRPGPGAWKASALPR